MTVNGPVSKPHGQLSPAGASPWSLALLTVAAVAACRDPVEHKGDPARVETEQVVCVADPGSSDASFDHIARALNDPPEHLEHAEIKRWAVDVVAATALESVVFAEHGNTTEHFDYPEPDISCLAQARCFDDYLQFQRTQLEKKFQFEPPSATEVEELVATTFHGMLAQRIARAASVLRAGTVQSGHQSTPLWILHTGHPSDHKRDAALAQIEKAFPGRFEVHRVDEPILSEITELVGQRLTAAVLIPRRFGGQLFVKGVTSRDQWIELLLSRSQIPKNVPRSPQLARVDAHMHLVGNGRRNLIEILDWNFIEKAVVTPLVGDPHYQGLEEANQVVLEAARRHPDRIVPFVMLSPLRSDPLSDLERYVAQGAHGVKLISGHGDFFRQSGETKLDTDKMKRVFRYCEKRGMAVLWHVNTHLFDRGFLRVLRSFPRLEVVNPHLGGYLTYAPGIVRRLLDEYPNLYLDMSLGAQPMYVHRSVEDLSFKRVRWRQLLIDHADRFLFGTDLVVTSSTSLAHANVTYRLQDDLLQAEGYDFDYVPPRGHSLLFEPSHHHTDLHGLELPEEVLGRIYAKNAREVYGLDN